MNGWKQGGADSEDRARVRVRVQGAVPLGVPWRIVIRRQGVAEIIVDTSVTIAILNCEKSSPDVRVIEEASVVLFVADGLSIPAQ